MKPGPGNLTLLVVLGLMLTVSTAGQQPAEVVITLKINLEVKQFSGQMIAERTTEGQLIYTEPASDGLGLAPGRVLFKLEPADVSQHTYRILIDSNSDGTLLDEPPRLLTPNVSTVVNIIRRWANGRQQSLPYSINYYRGPDQRGQTRVRFSWSPHYRADGRLKVGNCEALFAVLDLTSDGRFDSKDFSLGTGIGLDRNGDGRIWGKDEYLKGEQIIEYCGENFLIDSLAADGTSITLLKTFLRVLKIGEQLPEFVLATTDGNKIESKSLRNKVYLLDFWASWCKPCVEKFRLVKQLADEFGTDMSVIAINVDDEPQLVNARQVIKDYGLTWLHVMNGRGESDSIWKMFGAMEGNRLSIPLYVVVDAKGRLRYAANGGDDLSDLRKLILELLDRSITP